MVHLVLEDQEGVTMGKMVLEIKREPQGVLKRTPLSYLKTPPAQPLEVVGTLDRNTIDHPIKQCVILKIFA